MKNALVSIFAAFAEVAGCFSFWALLRLSKPGLWLLPGIASLALFAYLLTPRWTVPPPGVPTRPMAAFNIVASLLWLWAVEGAGPRRRDSVGARMALWDAGIIVFMPRG